MNCVEGLSMNTLWWPIIRAFPDWSQTWLDSKVWSCYMRLPASLVNCFKVFPGLVTGRIHPDMIILPAVVTQLVSQATPYPSPRVWLARLVMTVLLDCWSYLITVWSLLVVMMYMFTCFQGNHHWIYELQLFCPSYPWRTPPMELCLQC